ncbi:MAG: hypothetical protein Q8K63_03220, partial [Acidimicrobiales bacterium]|nr:hypothetical protein [Acidimicrobiales bacterium]
MSRIAAALLTVLAVPDALRWLRVAQREHYIAGSVTMFAIRWARVGLGLSWRGRTSKLVFTRRMKVLAVVTCVLHLVLVLGLSAVIPVWISALVALVLVPGTVDLALFATAPLERRKMAPFVDQASKKLKQISPTIVAITGS